jgi:hypothetical protein
MTMFTFEVTYLPRRDKTSKCFMLDVTAPTRDIALMVAGCMFYDSRAVPATAVITEIRDVYAIPVP